MNCDRFKEMILDSVLEEHDAKNNVALQKHIQTCASCRHEYEQMQSAVRIMKPEPGEGLSPIEKLKLENRIYEARLKRFAAGNSRAMNLKRLTAIAAALFFFFLGFSLRSFFTIDTGLEENTGAEQRVEDFPGGRFLLMAKGKKALAALESVKQLP